MIKMMFKFGVLFSFALLATGNSFALDSKIHPGVMCQPNSHSEAGDLSYYSSYVRTRSNAVGTTGVTCPVVRDNTTNLNGIDIAYLRANVPSGNTMSCYFDSREPLGDLVSWDHENVTAGKHSTIFNVNSSASRGFYAFLCYMPANTYIYSYRVDEY